MSIEEIHGGQFGVRFIERGNNDDHVCIQILCEDDEYWHEHGSAFSSFHLDDLIKTLEAAKLILEGMPKDPTGFGRRFA